MNTAAVTKAVEVALAELTYKLRDDPRWAALPSPLSEAVIRHDCAKPLEALLRSQSEFAKQRMVCTLTGRMGFDAGFVAPMLLEQAQKRGSAEAGVAWLAKVVATSQPHGSLSTHCGEVTQHSRAAPQHRRAGLLHVVDRRRELLG